MEDHSHSETAKLLLQAQWLVFPLMREREREKEREREREVRDNKRERERERRSER